MVDALADREALKEDLAQFVVSGGKILVFGWISANHNERSRQLEKQGLVQFADRVPELVADNTHVLFTRFTNHHQTKKLRRLARNITMRPLTIGIIRDLINAAGTAVAQAAPKNKTSGIVETKPDVITSHTPHSNGVCIVETTTPAATSTPTSTKIRPPSLAELAFAQDFANACKHDPKLTLGRVHLIRLIRKHFGEAESVRTIAQDLLEPVIGEGRSKIGWYQATPTLLEYMTMPHATIPSSPNGSSVELTRLEKAAELVGQKPAIEQRFAELKIELADLQAKLAKIDELEGLLKKFEGLV